MKKYLLIPIFLFVFFAACETPEYDGTNQDTMQNQDTQTIQGTMDNNRLNQDQDRSGDNQQDMDNGLY